MGRHSAEDQGRRSDAISRLLLLRAGVWRSMDRADAAAVVAIERGRHRGLSARGQLRFLDARAHRQQPLGDHTRAGKPWQRMLTGAPALARLREISGVAQ